MEIGYPGVHVAARELVGTAADLTALLQGPLKNAQVLGIESVWDNTDSAGSSAIGTYRFLIFTKTGKAVV